jgi:hypothetical protein
VQRLRAQDGIETANVELAAKGMQGLPGGKGGSSDEATRLKEYLAVLKMAGYGALEEGVVSVT